MFFNLMSRVIKWPPAQSDFAPGFVSGILNNSSFPRAPCSVTGSGTLASSSTSNLGTFHLIVLSLPHSVAAGVARLRRIIAS